MSEIYISTLKDVFAKPQSSDLTKQYKVDITAYIESQADRYPAELADGLNKCIAFVDACEKDFGISVTLEVASRAELTDDGGVKVVAYKCLTSWSTVDGSDVTLSVATSMAFTALASALGIDISPVCQNSDVAVTVKDVPQEPDDKVRYAVTVDVNNDPSNDIYDHTKADIVVVLDKSNRRWIVACESSLNIDTGKYEDACP